MSYTLIIASGTAVVLGISPQVPSIGTALVTAQPGRCLYQGLYAPAQPAAQPLEMVRG